MLAATILTLLGYEHKERPVEHPNIDLVRRVYGAYLPGNRDVMTTLIAPDVRWHNSGFDANSGELIFGIPLL